MGTQCRSLASSHMKKPKESFAMTHDLHPSAKIEPSMGKSIDQKT
jgi:hypothetical protein